MTQRVWRHLVYDPLFLFHVEAADIRLLEILTLLHDLNHYPFLHYFQEAGVKHVADARINERIFAAFSRPQD